MNTTFPLGELRARVLTLMDVRIHDILARAAARCSPTRIGATLGDEPRTFAELDAGCQPRRAPARGRGRRAARPGGVVGSDRARRARARLRHLASSAPPSRRSTPTSPSPRRRPRSRPARRASWSRIPTTRTPRARSPSRSGSPWSSPTPGWHDGASTTALPRVGDERGPVRRSSSPAGRPACRRARCSRTARPGCAPSQRDDEGGATRTPRRRRDVRPVPHGRLVLHRARVGGDRPVHLVHRADAARAARRGRAVARRAASTASPRCGNASSTTTPRTTRRRWSRCSPARRCVDLDLDRRVEGALPGIVDVGGLRLHRDRPRRGAARLRPLRPAAERRAAAARWSGADLADDGELLAARPDHVLRLPRPARRHRRGHRRRRLVPHRRPRDAATPTATSPSPAAARSRSARAASGWRRSRWRPPSAPTRRSPRSGVVGLPDARWGEVVCAAIVVRPGATLPTVEELRAHVASTSGRAQAATRGRRGRASSPAPTPPARSAAPRCVTDSPARTP